MLLVFRKVVPKSCICVKLGWSFKSPLFYSTLNFIFSNDKTSDYRNEMCLYEFANLVFKMHLPALITPSNRWEGYGMVRGCRRIWSTEGGPTSVGGAAALLRCDVAFSHFGSLASVLESLQTVFKIYRKSIRLIWSSLQPHTSEEKPLFLHLQKISTPCWSREDVSLTLYL